MWPGRSKVKLKIPDLNTFMEKFSLLSKIIYFEISWSICVSRLYRITWIIYYKIETKSTYLTDYINYDALKKTCIYLTMLVKYFYPTLFKYAVVVWLYWIPLKSVDERFWKRI